MDDIARVFSVIGTISLGILYDWKPMFIELLTKILCLCSSLFLLFAYYFSWSKCFAIA